MALVLAMGLVACRQEQVARYRIPKEAPPKPMVAPADHPPHEGHEPESAQPAKLQWTLPPGWKEEPGTDMRVATFRPPGPGKAEGTVIVLPGAAGGELANVNRWRGQIQLPPLDEKAQAAARKPVETKAGEAGVYDFSNMDTKARTVVGLLATPDGNSWFLKLTGDDAAVGKAKADFLKLIGSVHLD